MDGDGVVVTGTGVILLDVVGAGTVLVELTLVLQPYQPLLPCVVVVGMPDTEEVVIVVEDDEPGMDVVELMLEVVALLVLAGVVVVEELEEQEAPVSTENCVESAHGIVSH